MPLTHIEETRRRERRRSVVCRIGGVPVGGSHPVVVQSMTNTDTADPAATADQVALLAAAGASNRATDRASGVSWEAAMAVIILWGVAVL